MLVIPSIADLPLLNKYELTVNISSKLEDTDFSSSSVQISFANHKYK